MVICVVCLCMVMFTSFKIFLSILRLPHIAHIIMSNQSNVLRLTDLISLISESEISDSFTNNSCMFCERFSMQMWHIGTWGTRWNCGRQCNIARVDRIARHRPPGASPEASFLALWNNPCMTRYCYCFFNITLNRKLHNFRKLSVCSLY